MNTLIILNQGNNQEKQSEKGLAGISKGTKKTMSSLLKIPSIAKILESIENVCKRLNETNRWRYLPASALGVLMVSGVLDVAGQDKIFGSDKLLAFGVTYKPKITQFTDVRTGYDNNGSGIEAHMGYHQGRVRLGILGGYARTGQDDGNISYVADNYYGQATIDIIGSSRWGIAPYVGIGLGLHRTQVDFTEKGKTTYSDIPSGFGSVRYGVKFQLADLADSKWFNGLYIQIGSTSDFPLTNKDKRLDGNTSLDGNNGGIDRGKRGDRRDEGFRPLNFQYSVGFVHIIE